jgi:hypothetical protein
MRGNGNVAPAPLIVIVLDVLVSLLLPLSCPNASFDVTEYDGMTPIMTGIVIDNDMEKTITTRAAMGERCCLVLQM